MDPNFNENDIDQALYVAGDDPNNNENVNFSNGLIFAKTPEAAFNIESLLHKRNVADFFQVTQCLPTWDSQLNY